MGVSDRLIQTVARRPTIATAACVLFPVPYAAHGGLGTAIEFYNPSLRHYFITAHPEEAAALDTGNPIRGWIRAGVRWLVPPVSVVPPCCGRTEDERRDDVRVMRIDKVGGVL